MHNEAGYLLDSIGKLVKRVRAETMDQTELGKRVGLSRTTISSIERGIGVNANALFKVLCFLGLIELLQEVINDRLVLLEGNNRSRKVRKPAEELSNDF